MKKKGIVAIVGRPNVGKSTLFNRIIKEKKSIVEDVPGVTRDRLYGDAEWLTVPFILIDTGGITLQDTKFAKEIKVQAEIAIKEADLILFVLNYKDGICPEDNAVLRILYKTNKPIILVINKYDKKDDFNSSYEYMSLGLGEPILVSSTHGIGIGDLLDKIIENLPKANEEQSNDEIKIAVVGKPNVGKSSFVNALLGEKRMIVSEIPGTTTDSVDSKIEFDNIKYSIIDTAGLRKKGKIYENIEKYSYIRSISSINKSDVVLLMLDISLPITDHDSNIGGFAYEESKPIIIIANKWDLVEKKDSNSMNKKETEIRSYFKYLSYAKILFISAVENIRVKKIFELISLVNANLKKRIKTSVLNEIFNKAQLINPAPNHNGGRLKIYYSSQVEAYIPTFVLFVNNPGYAHFSYRRYLENQIRQHFDFTGVPMKIIFRERR
ncbi:ribosome biogenesis GTPase Der [Spiroplasma turonicum]|uniref:GTPase Der n=1 Tax=Spiroplasma turonicum TaxID=216946 RepID=A0A0K1P715_9MOLU|nr:ribosome biogenesis GTPase Der [Spiroplasma turonicum]AKU80106.1 GTP-binding protein EngA [Spiroplasma turonicum]ALX71106.1 GTP-binding protein EngA [Spiroplasma turonicum]